MDKRVGVGRFGILALLASMFLSDSALGQQPRIMICGAQPNPPSGYRIELDMGTSRVFHIGQWHQASFSDRGVQWHVPRYEPGTGEVRPATTYFLDRHSGALSATRQCLQRDWQYCRDSLEYCRAAQPIY